MLVAGCSNRHDGNTRSPSSASPAIWQVLFRRSANEQVKPGGICCVIIAGLESGSGFATCRTETSTAVDADSNQFSGTEQRTGFKVAGAAIGLCAAMRARAAVRTFGDRLAIRQQRLSTNTKLRFEQNRWPQLSARSVALERFGQRRDHHRHRSQAYAQFSENQGGRPYAASQRRSATSGLKFLLDHGDQRVGAVATISICM